MVIIVIYVSRRHGVVVLCPATAEAELGKKRNPRTNGNVEAEARFDAEAVVGKTEVALAPERNSRFEK